MNMKKPADYPMVLLRLHYCKDRAARRILWNINSRERVKQQFQAIMANALRYPSKYSDEDIAVAEATLKVIRILEIQGN